MKLIAKIAVGIAVIVLAILAYATTRPDSFTVKREATIPASPDKVYALIDDYAAWPKWSPWEKLDPNLKRTMSETTAGKGASYEWSGNDKVGAGRMEILDDTAPSSIHMKLDFYKPMAANDEARFTLTPEGDATVVTWEMSGKSPYSMKVMGLFMDFDSMIGKDFEKGFANLKEAVAEAIPAPPAAPAPAQ